MRVAPAGLCLLAVVSCSVPQPRFSGTVQTEYISVGSQVGGRVIEVDVSAGQTVKRGAVIVRLDPAMPKATYDQAVAQERAAQAALSALRTGSLPSQIASAHGASRASSATVTQLLASERLAEQEYARTAALAKTGDVSQESLDQARAALDEARAEVRQSRANAVAAHRTYSAVTTGAPPTIEQAQSQLRSARASAAHALSELREATVYATADGVIASFNLHPGDMLVANQPAAVIDTFADPYVYIYASQSDLERVRAAKSLTVHSDAGAGDFQGEVEAYDRTAQFTPTNVETADQRAELVYGVKVRIHDPQHKLHDGTTVTVDPQ